MVDKKKNREKGIILKEIAKKYDLSALESEIDGFIKSNDEYKAHILMIGGYSSGKSALLNKFIGKSVLKEDQGPETDIAAELHFCEREYIVANYLDGTKKEISSVEEVNTEEVRNIEYYIDSINIKKQSDYIMVDTPGFDSGIEKHNKALMQYIDYGTAFFLTVDCEKGTISESTQRFVNEVTNYSVDIAVIINKCDKKIPEEVMEVKEHIEDLLLASSGRTFPVICTSIYDDDVEEKLTGLIREFHPQYLYDKNITSILKSKCKALIDALELIRSKETCDTSEIEEEIGRREKAGKRLSEQIDIQKKRLSTKLHNEVKERILSNIHSQLMCHAGMLAEAYKGGVEMFQERVVEIVRPILISEVENYSSIAYKDLLRNLNYGSLNIADNTEELEAVIKSVYGKLKDLSSGGLFVPAGNNAEGTLVENGLKTYKAISSVLAIVTDAIAPPLELLIIFLPDIIKLFNAFIGKPKEERLAEGMQNKIIPQIVSKLRSELDKPLSEIERVMADNLSANIEEILNIENSALETARNKKKELETRYSDFMEAIDKDIEIIRGQVI